MTDDYKQIADRIVKLVCGWDIDERGNVWEYPDELQDAARDAADAIYELLEDVPKKAEWEERTVERRKTMLIKITPYYYESLSEYINPDSVSAVTPRFNSGGCLLDGCAVHLNGDSDPIPAKEDVETMVGMIREAQKANPDDYAEWEERTVEGSEPWFRRRFYCSACGEWQTYGKTKWCMNCGARMKEDE